MTRERRANLEGKLAELEHELWLAIKQGQVTEGYRWQQAIHVPGYPDPYFAVLTVGRVRETKTAPTREAA